MFPLVRSSNGSTRQQIVRNPFFEGLANRLLIRAHKNSQKPSSKVTERQRRNPLKIQEKSSKSGDIQRPKNTVFGLLLSPRPPVRTRAGVPKSAEISRFSALFYWKSSDPIFTIFCLPQFELLSLAEISLLIHNSVIAVSSLYEMEEFPAIIALEAEIIGGQQEWPKSLIRTYRG